MATDRLPTFQLQLCIVTPCRTKNGDGTACQCHASAHIERPAKTGRPLDLNMGANRRKTKERTAKGNMENIPEGCGACSLGKLGECASVAAAGHAGDNSIVAAQSAVPHGSLL